MTIAESFGTLLQTNLFGTLGTDLFISGLPQDAPNLCWWIIAAGGAPESRNHTGEMVKNYILSVYYRNTDASDVYETMQELEEFLNSNECTQLSGYDTIEIEAISFPADQDIESQDMTVGLMQVRITTYYS